MKRMEGKLYIFLVTLSLHNKISFPVVEPASV